MMPLKDHLDFPDKVKFFILTKQFNELRNFVNFSLCKLMAQELLTPILQSNHKPIIKYVFNNACCYSSRFNNYLVIHYVCHHETVESLKILIKNGVDLECETYMLKNRPIHLACKHGSLDMIKLLICNGVTLDCKNIYGETPIDFATLSKSQEVINFFNSL